MGFVEIRVFFVILRCRVRVVGIKPPKTKQTPQVHLCDVWFRFLIAPSSVSPSQPPPSHHPNRMWGGATSTPPSGSLGDRSRTSASRCTATPRGGAPTVRRCGCSSRRSASRTAPWRSTCAATATSPPGSWTRRVAVPPPFCIWLCQVPSHKNGCRRFPSFCLHLQWILVVQLRHWASIQSRGWKGCIKVCKIKMDEMKAVFCNILPRCLLGKTAQEKNNWNGPLMYLWSHNE